MTKLRAALARTNGRARETMFRALRAGAGPNQRRLVAALRVPLAVVNGSNDPVVVSLDHVDSIDYATLWRHRCKRIAAAGHVSFRESPAEFNELPHSFLVDVERGPWRLTRQGVDMGSPNRIPCAFRIRLEMGR